MPLATSKRQAAINDLVTRLGFIQTAKGYNTDAGLSIFLGEWPRFGPDDPDSALGIAVGDDSSETIGGLVRSRVPIEVWAFVPAGTSSPLVAIEAIIADIKEAVEIESNPSRTRALGDMVEGQPHGTTPKGLERGVTRALRREEGTQVVGAAVEYIATFEDQWGSQ